MNNTRLRRVNSDITEGKLKSSFHKLAAPMMVGAVLQDLFSLADLFFVGRLGYVEVAALSISGIILSVIIMVSMGISTGTTALIAHFTGNKNYEAADNTLFQTTLVSVIFSLAMVLIGLFGTTGLLRIFGASSEVIPAASGYLKITFVSSIFMFLFISFSQALRGSGDAVTPFKILVLANVINIALDPLFIFGFGFFPRLEVAGSAIATVISQVIGVTVLLWHFLFGHSSLHFHKGIFKVNFPIIGRMLKIGFFASLEVVFRQLSFLLLLRLITSFGVACLAAYGIVIRLRMVIMMLGFGIGGASGVLIGQNMGAGHPERATQSGWQGLKYYELIVIPAAIMFFIFASPIIGVFSDYPEVIKIGSNFLRFVAFTFPFLASALILSRSVQGAGDTIAPAVMTGIVQLGLRIPVAYFLALILALGTNGIWLAINVSDVVQGIAMIWYFKGGFWQKRYRQHRAILEQGTLVAV